MAQELTEVEKRQLAREIAADQYDREWPLRTTLGNIGREGFVSGWDAAMEYVVKRRDLECGFCWVCRTHHRLTAEHCRAMDGIT